MDISSSDWTGHPDCPWGRSFCCPADRVGIAREYALQIRSFLYRSLEVFSDLGGITTEFFKLPLVLDSIGEVLNHLSVCDIIDLGS